MDIILVSGRLAQARTIRLTGGRLALVVLLGCVLLVATAILAQYAIARLEPGWMSDGLRAWLAGAQAADQQKQQVYMHDSLDAMAKRVGEMQAKMMRLDALGSRLAQTAGIKPKELSFDKPPGEGGPYVPAGHQDVSLESMNQQLDNLSLSMDDRNDKLVVLETLLLQDRSSKWLIPSVAPVKTNWYSSNFGLRIDPFTGRQGMHEGIDFAVPEGTSVYASAGGVVEYADLHPQYGNLVEIDHGNGVITRYAHNSRLLVKVGQMVRRGQKIALSGTTGRSTGPHVHFEVRYKGIAQNPVRFLKKDAAAG